MIHVRGVSLLLLFVMDTQYICMMLKKKILFCVSVGLTKRHFTWCKFSPQTTHFCCDSAFFSQDNGVLVPPETTYVLNRVPECSLLKLQPSFRLCKLVNRKATLMLIVAQFSVFHNSHYETLIKHSRVHPKQVQYDDRQVFAAQF